MTLSFLDILQMIGASALVFALVFVIACVVTSFSRFQILSHLAHRQAATGSVGKQELKLHIANLLGVMVGKSHPFSVLLMSARADATDVQAAALSAAELKALLDAVLRHTLRVADDIVPCEGDRIALLMSCRAEAARRVMDRLKVALSESHVVHKDGKPLRITASIGLVAFPEHGDKTDILHDRLVAAWEKASAEQRFVVEGEGAARAAGDAEGAAHGADADVVDTLTGVLRSEEVPTALQKFVAKQRTEQIPVAVIYIDVDNFRRYVDRYGTSVGDQVLQAISRVLQLHVREDDLIGRGGGDEFVISCPGGTPEQALAVAKRVAAAIKKHSFSVAGTVLRLNISAGVACVPEHELTGRAALEAAKLALRVAKAKGRNMCVLYEPSMQGAAGPAAPVDTL